MDTRRDFIKAMLLAGASLVFAGACSRIQTHIRVKNSDAVRKLRASLSGRVIVPDDPEYEVSRRVVFWNPATDKHPQIVAQCVTADDVARCVDFARRQQLTVAVRSGGTAFSDGARVMDSSSDL